MCGILLVYNSSAGFEDQFIEFYEGDQISLTGRLPNGLDPYISDKLIPLIQNRGPNYISLRSIGSLNTLWVSSILSLRQPFTTQSVVVGDNRFVLQFNGELYNDEIQFNDTQYIVSLLSHENCDIPNIIRRLNGEFSYTIFDTLNNSIYFGRDAIGKRSLSYYLDTGHSQLYVASVTGHSTQNYINCKAGIIYRYDTLNHTLDSSLSIQQPYKVTNLVDLEQTMLCDTIDHLYLKLARSVQRRIDSIHPRHVENSPIAVLFSGGLDCSVLVALICRHLITNGSKNTVLELLNVAFENPRTKLQPCDAPDRKLAIQSHQMLQNMFPTVKIKLIEIDIPYDEYLKFKPRVIDLMYPKQTEMDLSIAIAFYFASRGVGHITEDQDQRIPYTRHGIVLFSGLGADELYGGYHKFNNKSLDELTVELASQINNIHDRNLNRDDKVIADNGVEVRYPFLDNDVVKYSTEKVPINFKINKLILRELADKKLNLDFIAMEPKRAIQFGSKSAKMTKDGNKNGTDILKP